ncbi:MAG TPA: ABC transporter permease subunit [Acidimicrobiales bacterium]|nr:ABC transporter permease subunit [Acidimicrobiales bacterium]
MTLQLASSSSRGRRTHLARRAEAAIAVLGLAGAWQLLATTVFAGRHVIPPPGDVVSAMVRDRFYVADLGTTMWEAGRGWLIGNVAAVVLAMVALLVPRMSRGLQRFGAITYCVPTVAIGPLLLIFLGPDAAKVLISALSVFFVSLVACLTGLSSTAQSSLDLVRAYGGGRATELFRVRVRGAIPAATGGLALSAPAAILGAIIGEYLGGDQGLGVAMVSAEESFQVPRTWAIGLVATAVSGLAYSAIKLALRAVAGAPDTGTATSAAPAAGGVGRLRLLRRVLTPLTTLAGVVLVWAVALRASGLSPYFAKSPAAVWSFLVTGPGAASNRGIALSALGTTMQDAMLGWLVGTVCAVAGAAVLVQVPRLGTAAMPIIMTLRSVPLVAMTPLVALVFGQGLLGVVVIAGIVSFVPSLVLVASGLESVPPQALELARAYNMSGVATLVRVRARYALPSLFAATKVAMPGSILGAVLAEWLLTGDGLGHLMAAALIGSDFNTLWSSVAIVSAVTLVLYGTVGYLESASAATLSS